MIKTHFRIATEEERKARNMIAVAMALDLYEDNHLVMTIFPDAYWIDEEIIKKVYYNSVRDDMLLTYAPACNC